MSGLSSIAARLGLMRQTPLRHLALAILSRVGQHDATIRHHWVPNRSVTLHRFRHRAYWVHGRAREQQLMGGFAKLVRPGDTVIELGAHIGYISVYFASLVGPQGRVFVFEPSPANLEYTRRNVTDQPTITLVEKAASDSAGTATFFIEELTGQNSTLLENYSVFDDNRALAFSGEGYRPIEVETTTVDLFVEANDIRPNFIKIDVEGAELACLRGSVDTINRLHPRLMVEVAHQHEAVYALLSDLGYRLFRPDFGPFDPAKGSVVENLFCIHRDDAFAL